MQFTHSFFAIAALALATTFNVVVAQATAPETVNTAIAEVLLQLEGTRVIPNLLEKSQLDLHAGLTQTFGSQNISTGQLISRTEDVKDVPSWSIQYTSAANDSSQFASARFTIMTLDPGAASDQPRNIVRHYLANNVSLSSTGELRNTSKPIAGWFSPAPPAGDGVHRYTTLVFRQNNNTLPTALQNVDPDIELNFDLANYIKEADLGEIVAANFFLAQNDDTSASVTATGVVSTTAVPSASVAAAASSVSSSLSSVYATASSNPQSKPNAAVKVGSSHASVALACTAVFVALGAFML